MTEPAARSAAHALLVVNRAARKGNANLDAVIAALAPAWRPEVLAIEHPGDLTARLDAAMGTSVGCVVVAGGDGTVCTAASVAMRHGRPLGVIPLGTANDFARTLGVPEDPAEAAAVVARGRTRRVDVAEVNGCVFLNAASIGLGSDLHKEVTSRAKRLLGPLAYPFTLLRRGWSKLPFHVELCGDGLDGRYHVVQVTIANGRNYGGGMTVHEHARIDDGRFDVLLIRARPVWQYALHAVSLKTGVYGRDSPMIVGRARRLEVRTRRPKTIATDGENRTRTPAAFRMLPGALEVFAP